MRDIWNMIREYFLSKDVDYECRTTWINKRIRKLQNWDENACKALVKWEKR